MAAVARPTFVVNTPIRDLGEYRVLAKLAVALKRHGRVEMNISSLAEKARHEMPAGGSPWHEYAACNPTPARFFPDEMVAPFVPESFVKKNRELLLAKADILREHGLGAAFWSYEPNFLPEAFFAAYPALRGPRTDHPRRSRQEEFAPCVDAPETREMTSRMVADLVRHVPELGTYFFKTNDAGPGLCWSDWQYTGANGPSTCRHRPMGQRVHDLLQSIIRGGKAGGADLTVHMTGNFSRSELAVIRSNLPTNSFIREGGSDSISIGSCADALYPVRGVLNVITVLQSLQRLKGRTKPTTVFVDLRSFYDRGYERLDASQKIIEIIDDFLAAPAFGHIAILERARAMCHKWVGPTHGDALFEIMVELHEALKYKNAALPRVSSIYGGVSLRYVTRPLLVLPERLTADEEGYFLPHVFNVSHERARLDYIDVHGTRQTPEWVTTDSNDPRIWAIDTLRARLNNIAGSLEKLIDAPDGTYWRKMATAVRVYANILRSCGNFFAVQIIRDRNAERFAGEKVAVKAQATSTGHPELAMLNEIMRDELDNASEMISLLQRDGLDVICHADGPEDEDTFLLGPDIVKHIDRKREIMRKHWLDAEAYFTTPNK